MKRYKPYDVPHKGIRNALSQLSLLAGKTDFLDKGQVVDLRSLANDVFSILTIHARDEDQVTLAELEKRCLGCSDHDIEDHKKIHHQQQKLETQLSKMCDDALDGNFDPHDGEEFYLGFSEFHSHYLEHTAEEERVTQPLLWKYFTDDELMGHRSMIMSNNPPETLLTWFKFVIPAQTLSESVQLLRGFKKMASPDFFHKGMSVIKGVVPEKEYSALKSALDK